MKKLLWTSAMALATMACLTACDETSSSSYEIPSYNSDTSLPDTCSMEVAKVDTAYFACFENKWVQVTDSATVEQLKEGLDEEEIKAKLEELESLLVKPANNTPKPTSSSAQSEIESSDDEDESSSSSEEEEEEPSSSSKKKKDKDNDDSGSGEGGSGSGEGGSGEGGETELARAAVFAFLDSKVKWLNGDKAELTGTTDEIVSLLVEAKYNVQEQEEYDSYPACVREQIKEKLKINFDITSKDLLYGKELSDAKRGAVVLHTDGEKTYAFVSIFNYKTIDMECKDESSSSSEGGLIVSSSSLKRDIIFSVIDEYVTWDEDGTTATLNDDITAKELELIFKADDFNSLNVANRSTLENATTFLNRWGSSLNVNVENILSSKAVYDTPDSNYYILIVRGLKKGSAIYTDIAPVGKCGTSPYAKRTQFCNSGTAYPLCDGEKYDPTKLFCDTRGTGTLYKYVTIGTMTWMAENLRYVPEKGTSYCKDETKADCGTYGRLYTWITAMGMSGTCNENSECSDLGTGNVQGVCPTGWHIPSGSEMETLAGYSGSVLFDVNGFNAQKSGYYHALNGEIVSVDSYAGLWSTKQYGAYGYRISMEESNTTQTFTTNGKKYGNPVRCIKD